MHRYRMTVEPLTNRDPQQNLQFEVENDDDLIAVAKRIEGRLELDRDAASAFAIGMKLFSETLLKNRERALFELSSQVW